MCVCVCVCSARVGCFVRASIVHQQMTLAALVTHKLYSSHRPHRGIRSKERPAVGTMRWCNRDDRVRYTHTESAPARVKTLQGQTSAHRYEDLVYRSHRLILMLRLTGSHGFATASWHSVMSVRFFPIHGCSY